MSGKVVTLLIHIRGRLVVEGPQVSYDGGQVATSRVLDIDRFHFYDLLEVLSGLECSKVSKLFYKLRQCTPTNHIVSELQCETNMREMFNMYGVGAEINVYVDDPFHFEDDMESEMEGEVDKQDEGEERGVVTRVQWQGVRDGQHGLIAGKDPMHKDPMKKDPM